MTVFFDPFSFRILPKVVKSNNSNPEVSVKRVDQEGLTVVVTKPSRFEIDPAGSS